jgi:hypothetical protein
MEARMRSLLVSLALAAALTLPTVASARPAGPIGSAFAGHSAASAPQHDALPVARADTVKPAQDDTVVVARADTVEPAQPTIAASHAHAAPPAHAAHAPAAAPVHGSPAVGPSDDISTAGALAIVGAVLLAAAVLGAGAARLRWRKPAAQV